MYYRRKRIRHTDRMLVRIRNFSLGGGGGGADPEAIYNLSLILKNHVKNITVT
jgi:hypothetical protein